MTPEEILQEIANIRQMIKGSISPYDSNDGYRTYRNFTSYHFSKSTTAHLRQDQVQVVRRLIDERKRFRELVDEYELAIIRRTRQELGIPLQDPAPEQQPPQAPPAAPSPGVDSPDGSAGL